MTLPFRNGPLGVPDAGCSTAAPRADGSAATPIATAAAVEPFRNVRRETRG
jgi:hypothetical protein